MSIKLLKDDLKKFSNSKKAQVLQRFFKTGKGEYGEGDIFLGITVPESRKIAINYSDLSFREIKFLLNSKIHEERLIALLILVHNYKKYPEKREVIYQFYLSNISSINNWDLVDLSAHKIIGEYLLDKKRSILYTLAKSKNIWARRISIISTFAFIKENDFVDSIKLANLLLSDSHDLIHKSVGWVLREIGKKDFKTLETFLNKNYKKMPRTMLRYSIEKFPENLRKAYLFGKI